MAKTSLFSFLSTLLCLLVAQPAVAAPDPPAAKGEIQVIGLTPTGTDVPAGRELVIRFNRPMVPVGRMERTPDEVPVKIEPPLVCDWRWTNTATLACQLNDRNPMAPATTYTVKVKPGLKAHDGVVMKSGTTHTFNTERPKVVNTYFEAWQSPVHPVIRVSFNQPVSRNSVESHMYLKMQNGARVALKAEESSAAKPRKVLQKLRKSSNHEGTYWFLHPTEELPMDAKVELWVEPGVVPLKGQLSGAESRGVVGFHTFPNFGFVGVRCMNIMDKEILLRPGAEPRLGDLCNPLDSISLVFTSPVINSEIKKRVKFTPDLAGGRKDYDPWENTEDYSRLADSHVRGDDYSNRLPEMLRANKSYTIAIPPGKLRDEFGRPLAEGVKMTFGTDHRKPNYAFGRTFSVLEKKVDSELPIIVTNLAQINVKYSAVTGKGSAKKGEELLSVAPAPDIAYAMPLKVRDMLKAPSGLLTGEISTAPPLPGKSEEERWFFTQVTPFNVQVKVGHFNTLVWVTDFATGLPVPGVQVDVVKGKLRDLPTLSKALHHGVTDAEGVAILPGTEKVDPDLKLLGYTPMNDPKLFVRCTKGGDIALVPLTEDFNANYYSEGEDFFQGFLQRRYRHIHTWGTTAQGVYKVGDTVQFKLYVRNQDNKRFVPPPLTGYSLEVYDPMGKVVHTKKNITLSEFGAYDGTFAIPATGAVGWYRFVLKGSHKGGEWEPMQVLVSDFTPSPFRVTSELNGKLFQAGDGLKITTLAKLHAGGPYANAQARITAELRSLPFTTDDPRAKGYSFDPVEPGSQGVQMLFQKEEPLSAGGELVSEGTLEPADLLYGRIDVESAVRDDRGKYIAGTSSATFVGRDRFVGLFQPDWTLKVGEPVTLKALVVDEQGKVAPGTQIDIEIEYRKTVASRVKGAGNAYLTHFEEVWERAGGCSLQSADEGADCAFTPAHPGLHRIIATIKDTQGREQKSYLQRWTVGKGEMVWANEANNSLTMIPEKTDYRVGETAKFLVQNPYPGAKALVTVERYGVMKHWVQTLADASTTVEYKVEPDDVPGFHLSVVVVSPRVARPLDKNQVDLGKPAFRMGYTEISVKEAYKELRVEITPEKKEYKPGATVAINFHAATKRDREGKQPPIELAVAVLDEAVFDLIKGGRSYFDVYRGFYYLDPLDMKNFNILMQLVGRQKFEKKGANAGGDGGPDLSLRSTFKFVSYWNPSLRTDENGKARVEFQVPDNLTGWRVLAMAVTKDDLMGLGDGVFTVSNPVEIRPVMPNQVTEGDSLEAGFSVMNRTDKQRTLEVTVEATGAVESGGAESVTMKKQVIAPPYARTIVRLPLKTKGSGKITLKARAYDGEDGDAVQHVLPVLKRSSLEVAAAFGTTTAKEVTEEVAVPTGIRTDIGKLSVSVAPSVIGNLEGAFAYMRDYPYSCWEQKLSKGVMAAHYRHLKEYLPADFTWPESKSLPQATLKQAVEFQAPGGGMTFFQPSDTLASPYLSAYTALAFNWLRQDGYQVPEQVENRLHDYLQGILRNNTMPSFYSKGMASTVRAVALAALAPHGKVTVADLKRYRDHLPEMSLFGKAHFLQALLDVKGTEAMRTDTANMILAHGSETSGKFMLQERLDDGYDQILTSTMRDNAAALAAFVAYAETPPGKTLVGDIPYRMVRSITQTRGRNDGWENTQENLFVLNALIDYKRVYEKENPAMTVTASFAGDKLGSATFDSVRDPAKELERPLKSDDAGKKGTVTIHKEGTGRLYYATRLFYSPKELKKEGVNAGIEVHREYSVERNGKWTLLSSPLQLKVGELVKVDLYLSLRAPRNFVVVNDPVPGGLEPVNRDLATASTVDAAKAQTKRPQGSFWFRYGDWIDYGFSYGTFYHKELRHHAARFYSEYLPSGNYHLSYVAQAIAPGEFASLPTHAEEMYEPDVYGKGAPALLRVE